MIRNTEIVTSPSQNDIARINVRVMRLSRQQSLLPSNKICSLPQGTGIQQITVFGWKFCTGLCDLIHYLTSLSWLTTNRALKLDCPRRSRLCKSYFGIESPMLVAWCCFLYARYIVKSVLLLKLCSKLRKSYLHWTMRLWRCEMAFIVSCYSIMRVTFMFLLIKQNAVLVWHNIVLIQQRYASGFDVTIVTFVLRCIVITIHDKKEIMIVILRVPVYHLIRIRFDTPIPRCLQYLRQMLMMYRKHKMLTGDNHILNRKGNFLQSHMTGANRLLFHHRSHRAVRWLVFTGSDSDKGWKKNRWLDDFSYIGGSS